MMIWNIVKKMQGIPLNLLFRVIIENGFINSITTGDGIDQGEIISPMLCIFYNLF